jgi:hypothetical protein
METLEAALLRLEDEEGAVDTSTSPEQLLQAVDREIGALAAVMEGRRAASDVAAHSSGSAPAPLGGGGAPATAAARVSALQATVASDSMGARLLALRQQATAYGELLSAGVPTVTLARRHLELGQTYLDLGWPAAALKQADLAREVNKTLLAEQDLEDDVRSPAPPLFYTPASSPACAARRGTLFLQPGAGWGSHARSVCARGVRSGRWCQTRRRSTLRS